VDNLNDSVSESKNLVYAAGEEHAESLHGIPFLLRIDSLKSS
jgi:hypothetical protein